MLYGWARDEASETNYIYSNAGIGKSKNDKLMSRGRLLNVHK